MIKVDVISSDADVERLRKSMQDEMGLTDAEWWKETDPNDPPFAVGDKVWIENISGCGADKQAIKWIRDEQTIEKLTPMPCNDGPLWSVDLVGIPMLFSQHDLRRA